MFSSHHPNQLLAHCHGELDAEEARRMSEHLATCDSCRRKLDEIRYAIHLAEHLRPTAAPADLWNEIEASLVDRPKVEARGTGAVRRPRFGLVLASSLAVLIAAGAAIELRRPSLSLAAASDPPSEYEALASRFHRDAPLDIESADPNALNAWIHDHTALDAELAEDLPPSPSIRFLGAKAVFSEHVEGALVAYEVDGHRVSLLIAPKVEAAHPPAVGRFSKNVVWRSEREGGSKSLAWSRRDQSYVLISDLPGLGSEACFVCHTNAERRALIGGMHLAELVRPDDKKRL